MSLVDSARQRPHGLALGSSLEAGGGDDDDRTTGLLLTSFPCEPTGLRSDRKRTAAAADAGTAGCKRVCERGAGGARASAAEGEKTDAMNNSSSNNNSSNNSSNEIFFGLSPNFGGRGGRWRPF